jgi:hypothetical protein
MVLNRPERNFGKLFNAFVKVILELIDGLRAGPFGTASRANTSDPFVDAQVPRLAAHRALADIPIVFLVTSFVAFLAFAMVPIVFLIARFAALRTFASGPLVLLVPSSSARQAFAAVPRVLPGRVFPQSEQTAQSVDQSCCSSRTSEQTPHLHPFHS